MKCSCKIIVILILLQGCFAPINTQNSTSLKSIEVYSIPFGLHTPVSKDEQTIRNAARPFVIKDDKSLHIIDSLLNELQEVDEISFVEDVYLACDLYYSNGSKDVLLYNNRRIKLNHSLYYDSPELIKMITRLDH